MPDVRPKIHPSIQRCPTQSRLKSALGVRSSYVERNNNNNNNNKLLNMQKMLHPKADVERLYIPRKDGGRGLIDVETAFKTATIIII